MNWRYIDAKDNHVYFISDRFMEAVEMKELKEKWESFKADMVWFFNFKRKIVTGDISRFGFIYRKLPCIHFCKVCGRGIKKRYMFMCKDTIKHGRYYCYQCWKYVEERKRYNKIWNERTKGL